MYFNNQQPLAHDDDNPDKDFASLLLFPRKGYSQRKPAKSLPKILF